MVPNFYLKGAQLLSTCKLHPPTQKVHEVWKSIIDQFYQTALLNFNKKTKQHFPNSMRSVSPNAKLWIKNCFAIFPATNPVVNELDSLEV